MPTITVENYLKTLYTLQHRAVDAELVAMGALAAEMRVTPGTATSMVKALAESGLVEYAPRGGVRLSATGEKLALHVLRRHRLVELFLVEVLGLDWSEVDQEAEELEHAISDKVLARIDERLNHPEFDPHGDPIPSSKGKLPARPRLKTLAECEVDRPLRVARVLDQDPQFLQFVERNQLKPGMGLTVRERNDLADSVAVKLSKGGTVTLGAAAAAKILVEPEMG